MAAKNTFSGYTSSAGGYICPDCGSWIENGQGHACVPPDYSAYNIEVDLRSNDIRVAQALERIASALEKMVGDNQEEKDGDIT